MSYINLPRNTSYWLVKKACEEYSDLAVQKYKQDTNFVDISYKEIYQHINEVAYGLNELGMQKQDPVGLIADVGHQWMWVSMGINTIGGIDVPRGTDATTEDLSYIFQHTECKIIFLEKESVYKKIQAKLSEFKKLETIIFFEPNELKIENIKVLSLDQLKKSGKEAQEKNPQLFDSLGEAVTEEDLETIVYTSGTTGAPKGVMLTHGSLNWEISNLALQVPMARKGRTMGFLPPWHIAERLIESMSFYTGLSVAFTSVQSLAADLKTIKPTMLVSVPRVWESFYNKVQDGLKNAPALKRGIFNLFKSAALNYNKAKSTLIGTRFKIVKSNFMVTILEKLLALIKLPLLFIPNLLAQVILAKVKDALGGQVQFAISGAGALPEHIDRFFHSIGIAILETYGMTETCGVSVMRNYKKVVIGTLGKTFAGVEVQLRDEAGKLVTEPGQKGVAYHRGPHIMKGYYKEKEKTNLVLQDGWLNSGDILMYTTNGELKFAGRAKDTVVLLGGENVEPEPIERALSQSPYINQVVIVGQDKKTLAALIVPNLDEIKSALDLAGYKISEEINADKEVHKLFKQTIKALVSSKTGFKPYERVSDFHLLKDEFTPGEEMTQTLKVKRNVVFEKYAKEIEGMYR